MYVTIYRLHAAYIQEVIAQPTSLDDVSIQHNLVTTAHAHSFLPGAEHHREATFGPTLVRLEALLYNTAHVGSSSKLHAAREAYASLLLFVGYHTWKAYKSEDAEVSPFCGQGRKQARHECQQYTGANAFENYLSKWLTVVFSPSDIHKAGDSSRTD